MMRVPTHRHMLAVGADLGARAGDPRAVVADRRAWVPNDLTLRAPSLLASAGSLICVSQVWHLMAPLTPDRVNRWSYGVMSWTQLLSYLVLLLGVIALYGHKGPRAVRGRAVSFVAAFCGTVGILGDVWFETVMVPMALPHSPDLLNAQPTLLWMIGILITFGLFSLGWVATAVVLQRSRLIGTPTAIALCVGGLLGFFVLTAPRGVPFGVSLVLVARTLRRTTDPPNDEAPDRMRPNDIAGHG